MKFDKSNHDPVRRHQLVNSKQQAVMLFWLAYLHLINVHEVYLHNYTTSVRLATSLQKARPISTLYFFEMRLHITCTHTNSGEHERCFNLVQFLSTARGFLFLRSSRSLHMLTDVRWKCNSNIPWW